MTFIQKARGAIP